MKIENPAFNYEQPDISYGSHRQTDPRIAAYVHQALANAATVLNVGAGTGSYEPGDRYVVAVEPSASMRAQRLSKSKTPAVIASAGNLPFDDNAFDASMAMVTVHHWPDIRQGLKEMRRVTKGEVVVMSFDPVALDEFWNVHYFPELVEIERQRYPQIEYIVACLGGSCEIIKVPIPFDCSDGFQEAFYGRPEAFLLPEVRKAQSAWGFLPAGMEEILVERLSNDLSSGNWDAVYGSHRTLPAFTGALRLIVSKP